MTILESELEDLIFNKIQEGSFEELDNKGLHICALSKYYRQFNFGSYGIADIVGLMIIRDKNAWNFHVSIYELKKDSIGPKTLCQAAKYAKAVQRMADNWNYKHKNKRRINLNIDIHLIGQSIEGGGFIYLPDLIENLYLYQYKLDFDGIYFDQKADYHLSEEKPFKMPNIRGAIY